MTDDERLRRALGAENQRLRDALQGVVASCLNCKGSGRVARHEYDAASGRLEWAGMQDCGACKSLRELLAGTRAAKGTEPDELAHLRLLLIRKTEALAVFASPLLWDKPRQGEYVWQGDNECRNPMAFAAKERDADEPCD